MDNQLKFYLLAEKSGWDCSTYAYEYRKKITLSSSYQILSYNAIEAKKHLSTKAKEIVKEYNSLKLEPRTLEETFILETKINYLCLHSFPEYYINPLCVDPNYSGDVTTIGDLIVNVDSTDYTINELIKDETIPIERKKEAIREKTSEYVKDMNELVHLSLTTVEKSTRKKEGKSAFLSILSLLEIIIFILLHAFLAFILLYPQPHYWECFYHPRFNYALTYTSYLFPMALGVYDIIFIIFHTYKANVNASYHYAKKFLKKQNQKIYDEILQQSETLFDYILGAMNIHMKLSNDIKIFSELSSTYIDFKKVLETDSIKRRKRFKVLSSLNYAFATIIYLLSFVSFIFYLYSTILNISF